MRSRLAILTLIYWGLIAPICFSLQLNSNTIAVQTKQEIKAVQNKTFSLSELTPTITNTPKPTPIVTNTPIATPKPTVKPTIKPTATLSARSEQKEELSYKSDKMTFKVSAYDLGVSSCGKSRSNPDFGHTRSGFNLANKTRSQAMTIAADLSILPMGTRVYIEFNSSHLDKYNGVYTVRDTGGAIHGYKLDLFMGDNAHQEALDFGVQRANVRVID